MKQMTINGIPENTFKKTNLYRVSLVKDATIKYGDETVSSASIAARIFRLHSEIKKQLKTWAKDSTMNQDKWSGAKKEKKIHE